MSSLTPARLAGDIAFCRKTEALILTEAIPCSNWRIQLRLMELVRHLRARSRATGASWLSTGKDLYRLQIHELGYFLMAFVLIAEVAYKLGNIFRYLCYGHILSDARLT